MTGPTCGLLMEMPLSFQLHKLATPAPAAKAPATTPATAPPTPVQDMMAAVNAETPPPATSNLFNLSVAGPFNQSCTPHQCALNPPLAPAAVATGDNSLLAETCSSKSSLLC